VFVHDDYQNRGIGTESIKQLVAYADEKDYETLSLDSSIADRVHRPPAERS